MNDSGTLETFVPLVFKRRGIRRLADTGAVAHDPMIIEGWRGRSTGSTCWTLASLKAARPLPGPRGCTPAPSMNCCA